MQFTKAIKADGLGFTALVATKQVEEESTPFVHREGVTALMAFRIHCVSHCLVPL